MGEMGWGLMESAPDFLDTFQGKELGPISKFSEFLVEGSKGDFCLRMREKVRKFFLFSFASLSRIENISIISRLGETSNTTNSGGSRQQ